MLLCYDFTISLPHTTPLLTQYSAVGFMSDVDNPMATVEDDGIVVAGTVSQGNPKVLLLSIVFFLNLYKYYYN